MSPTPDSTLDPQQLIAELQRQLAESNAERDEALEQQAAIAEVLQVINSSPGDLQPVFEAMLDKAMRLCGAAFGLLNTYDGERFHQVALRQAADAGGQPTRFADYLAVTSNQPGRQRLRSGERLVHITDLSDEDIYRSGDPYRRAFVDIGGARTLLAVPLRKDNTLLGVLNIYRQEVRPFSDKQIALLENFAAQAVIAMENARLLGELRQRTGDLEESLEYQTATSDVLKVISRSTFDLQPMLDTLVQTAVRLCGAEWGNLCIRDGEVYRPAAIFGLAPEREAFARQQIYVAGRGTVVGRAVLEGAVVHSADMAADPEYVSAPGVRYGGTGAVLGVPLLREGEPLGAIALARRQAEPFTERQIELVRTFADQAVIAMENTRLITETREALDQQTATAEVLGVINGSPGDLAPVFDAMLEKATRLCGASFGILWSFTGDLAIAGALHRVPEAYAELCRTPFRPSPGSGPARMMRGEAGFALTDLNEYLPYLAGDVLTQAIVDLAGARSVVIEPLRKDATTLGAITLYREEVQPFTDKQIALLQNFAAQAVIAMENARLINETREALEQQTATAEVLGVINSSPGDLTPVFDAMLEKATRLCEGPFGILRTWDGQHFHFGAVHGDEQFSDWVPKRGPIRPDSHDSPLGRILKGEGVVCFTGAPDALGDWASPGFREMIEAGGIRSAITVALRKDEGLLGIITIYRQEVRPFSDKQVALLENFAAQAVIAMENARLLTETREALEQQTATAEVLQVINSSPGDLAPVFEAILERALDLCEAKCGNITIYDGETFDFVAAAGHAEFDEWVRQRAPSRPRPGTTMERMIRGERVVHIADIADDEVYRAGSPVRVALVEIGGFHTFLGVALRKDDALLGILHIYRQEVRPFTDKQIALLQNFAAQAVIAMENARLITETREALEQQTATAEVLGVINSSPGDLAPVFEAILEKALRICEASYGGLLTWDGEWLHRRAFRGASVELMEALGGSERRMVAPGSVADRLLHGENIIYTADLTQDPSLPYSPHVQTLARVGGARSFIAVPLRKDDRLLGFIGIYRREVRPFSEKEIALLQNFAAQAVIAMENARLINETREALEQQIATSEILQVINSSPGDLNPVFESIVEKALTLCEASEGVMRTFDGENFNLVAEHGDNSEIQRLRQLGPVPKDAPFWGPLVRGERIVHVFDVTDTEAYQVRPGLRERVELLSIRSWLAVALRKEGELLGAIAVYRREVRPFTDKQIALLQNFAAQAVIAMENARLLGELRQRTDEVGELNRGLEARVAAQVDELGRVGRLKRFLAPQLAELIVSQGDEKILESHRREIVVVFCDLRGYTAFTETAEPEEVLDFLRQYHGALGPLVSQFEGTLDQFSGDGIMVFFNDPIPCPDPAERAVKMAVAMREVAGALIAAWRRRGRMLGFGAGIAQGYATLGQIGFADRSGYTAIGTVCNLAARLCAEAKDGQILIAQLVAVAVEETTPLEEVGELTLKGLTQPVVAYNVPLAAIQPAFRVIEGGSPQTV